MRSRLGRGLHALVRRLQPLVQQLVDLLEGDGDLVEGLDHAGQELLLHGGERDIRLLAGLAFRLALAFGRLDHHLDLGGLALDGLALDGSDGRRRRIGAAAIGGVEIDDVAQQHLALAQALAPIEQRAIGERALGDAADHHVAAGLDALGDGDLALAGEQLDAAHLAQIHAHGIVGAADIGIVEIAGGALAALFLLAARGRGGGGLLGGRAFFLIVAFDEIDADLVQHRHGVLDLLRGHLRLRQGRIQLVIGDVAALLAAGDHLLDRRAEAVHQGTVGRLFTGFAGFAFDRGLRRHV